jgi:hypothetical protein
MIMKSLHHREKPITPRITDTMPLISNDIAKPPDIPVIPGDAPGNPFFREIFIYPETLYHGNGGLAR